VLTIWIITLLIVLLVIVPLAVSLLRRALQAARNIETYFRDMKEAGLRIAEHTAAVPALDQTIETGDEARDRRDRDEDRYRCRASCFTRDQGEHVVIAFLTIVTLIVVLVIVALVAYHLIASTLR